MVKLTKAEQKALEWFAERPDGASRFGAGDPNMAMVRRLRDAGRIEHGGKEPGFFGFVVYRISSAGRALLTQRGTNGK